MFVCVYVLVCMCVCECVLRVRVCCIACSGCVFVWWHSPLLLRRFLSDSATTALFLEHVKPRSGSEDLNGGVLHPFCMLPIASCYCC